MPTRYLNDEGKHCICFEFFLELISMENVETVGERYFSVLRLRANIKQARRTSDIAVSSRRIVQLLTFPIIF